MQGPWPFFLGSDRQMADDFFRPGFTASVWATGEPLGGLFYTVALGNNISELGVTAANDTRDLSTSASVWWMPTTGEFGPRGGLGDFEHHEELATRIGVSATRTREDCYAQISQPTPLNTQIRLSDGLLLFQTGALADGLTFSDRVTYAEMALDAGFKLRGFHLQGEYYLRWLGDFVADGPVPLDDIFDHGFFVQAMQMVVPRLLGLYATGSYIFDQFERHPWELGGGISVYPAGTRSWRLNPAPDLRRPLAGRIAVRLLRGRADRPHPVAGGGSAAVNGGRMNTRWQFGERALSAGAGLLVLAGVGWATAQSTAKGPATAAGAVINDVHLHLTDYVQEGPDIRTLLGVIGKQVGRAALFGVPLQQLWSQRVSGDNAPTYYLNADTPLYYYSFTDAQIAMAYRSLSTEQRARFDPMITGFNPADMYAVDHVRRVLRTFPGVFTGIGEFTIHKEFVSSKVAGAVASLPDPALDRVLEFAAESGLLVLLHNDIDVPFAKPGAKPVIPRQQMALLARHPKPRRLGARGRGSGDHPCAPRRHGRGLLTIELHHLHFDISWSEIAKYLVACDATIRLRPTFSTAIRTASCSAPTRSRPPDPERT